MKKLLLYALILGTSVVVVPAVEAGPVTTGAVPSEPQVRVQIGRYRGRRYRRARTVVTTRITRIGPWRYRETIRTTYLPNGMTRTVIIRRQRLGRWRNY